MRAIIPTFWDGYMVTKRLILVVFLCIAANGCKTFGRLLHAGGTEFTVRVSTEAPNRDDIMARAVKLIESKAAAIGLDVEVIRAPDAADVMTVKYYGKEPLEPVRKTLLTIDRLEMNKVITGLGGPTPYKTLNSAKAVLKDGQKALPFKPGGVDDQSGFLIVENTAVINGDDIRQAKAVERWQGNYAIEFMVKPDSVGKLKEWSGGNIGNYLAIILNDEILSAPVIKGEMSDSGMIEGRFTKTQADDLALSLNSGYLPATMTIIDEKPFEK